MTCKLYIDIQKVIPRIFAVFGAYRKPDCARMPARSVAIPR